MTVNEQPPIEVLVSSVYTRWVSQLGQLEAVKKSQGCDKRHIQIHLDELKVLFDEAAELRKKTKNAQLLSYLKLILSRPVHDSMTFAQGRHNVIPTY